MTYQEIGLLVLLAIVAVYVVAAWLFRSKSGQESPDILLEARLPQSGVSQELLNPAADTASLKNTKNRRRKKSRTTAKAPPLQETPVEKRTQKHHASPKPVARVEPTPEPKPGINPAPASDQRAEQVPEAPEDAKPVQTAVAAPTPAEKTEPKLKPALVEEIDPKLTGQILEVDDRLDAIEKLVASIEESLATFAESESETQSARKPGEAQAA